MVKKHVAPNGGCKAKAKGALNGKAKATLNLKAMTKKRAGESKAAAALESKGPSMDEELTKAQATCRDIYRTSAIRTGKLIRFQALALGAVRSYLGSFATLSEIPDLALRKTLSKAKKPGKAGSHIALAAGGAAVERQQEVPKVDDCPNSNGPKSHGPKSTGPKTCGSKTHSSAIPAAIVKPVPLSLSHPRRGIASPSSARTPSEVALEENAWDQDPSDHILQWQFCKRVMDGLGLPGDLQDMIKRAKSGLPMYEVFPWMVAIQAGLKFGTWRAAFEEAVSQKFPKLQDGLELQRLAAAALSHCRQTGHLACLLLIYGACWSSASTPSQQLQAATMIGRRA